MNAQIIEAIKSKRILTFSYHGYSRTVEPHTYGIDKKGHPTLCGYQTRGGSRSGSIPDWRYYHDVDMIGLTVQKETFSGSRSGYKRSDKFFVSIYCEL